MIENKTDLLKRIDDTLNAVRPHLVADGGDIEVVDITDEGIVMIKWIGNCKSCNMSAMTLKGGIESSLLGKVPEVTGVKELKSE